MNISNASKTSSLQKRNQDLYGVFIVLINDEFFFFLNEIINDVPIQHK